jgi:hypothetical protein
LLLAAGLLMLRELWRTKVRAAPWGQERPIPPALRSFAGRWEIEREGIKGNFGDIASAIVPLKSKRRYLVTIPRFVLY